jgi:hypothetical protein
LVVENAQLKGAKTFILIVDVMWNKIARQRRIYKKVLVRVSANSTISLKKVENKDGLKMLEKVFLKHAR